MAVLTREDYMQGLKSIIADRTDDDALKFVEDMTDTYDSFDGSSRIDELQNQLDALTEERNALEASWRKRYRDRFFGTGEPLDNDTAVELQQEAVVEVPQEDLAPDPEDIDFEDLFEEV